MKHNYTTRSIRHWEHSLFGFLLLSLLLPVGLRAQTTLAPGDLVFVGYNGSDDQGFTGNGQAITPGSNVNDKFAFVLLKDVVANTKIFFTDHGWLTSGGFQPAWVAGPANGGSGTGSKDDGILSWTASTSVAAGTQVVIRCEYTIGASIGIVAVVEAVSGHTYPLNLADADNDQLFAYQASSGRSTPTLLAGVMYGDIWSTSLNATEYTSAKSILPPALALTPSAALNLPSTSTIYNTYALGIYNCSVITGFPKQLRNAVTTQTKWKDYVSTISYPGYGTVEGFLYNTDPDYLTAVPAGWDVPIGCTFTVLQVLITSQPASKTVCSYQSATFSIAAQNAQTYKWQVSSDGSTNWTDLANGAVYSGVTSTTLTVINPIGLNGKFYRGVAMEPTEPSSVPSNAAQLTVNNPPQALALNPSGNITCVVPAVTLTASSGTSGLTYAYRGPAGVISSNPAANTISAGQGGLYSVTATTTQSCTASASFTVIEDKTPPASVGLTASGPLTCTATSVTLTAAASATSTINYTFTGPQGSVPAVGNKAVVSAAGTYTVTATASTNGCTATATTNVTSTTTAPTATLANNGPITCASPSITLTAGTNTGTRFVFSTGAAQIGGSSGNTATVTGSGTYSVVITADNGCTATASTTVTASLSATATLSNSGPISATATSVTLTAGGGTSYVFSAGATQVGNGPTATVTTAGVYSVTLTAANGCQASATTTVITTDLTPIISVRPSTAYNTTPLTVVVDIVEINGVASTGLITVKIPNDPKVSLSLNPGATSVNNHPVQNSVWTLSGPSSGLYTLTTSQVIGGGRVLSVGLSATLTPGATQGTLTVSAILMGGSGGEVRLDNNNDADKIEYFPQ